MTFKDKQLKKCQDYAISKDGLCLATIYIDNKTKMLWQCSNKHQWLARWDNVGSKGSWCKQCVGLAKPEISILQDHANRRNGKLKSIIYLNNRTPVEWECEKQHTWWARWNNVKDNDSWCPYCTSLKFEKKCKDILESTLKIAFLPYSFNNGNQRFAWDGYNEEHKIAFEYNGRQHYEFPNHCHQTEEEFILQIERDTLKLEYAIKNGIKLYTIPFTENNNLEEYIHKLVCCG